MDREAVIARLTETLATLDGDLAAAYLFGSAARGEARPGSDVDVAILLRQEPEATLGGLRADLADTLAEALGRPVDLVVLNRAPADLIHRVLRDGVLLLDRDSSLRIAFEVRSRNEYFDLLPYLREYRRAGEREGS